MNPRFLFFIIFGVVVLAGLFFIFKPESAPKQTANTKVTPSSSIAPTISTEKTFILEVKNKKLVSGEKTLAVTEGDTVVIKITSDEEEELHLHGYDASVELEAGKPAQLSLTADKTGHFPYELEHSGTEIGALEVMPK